MRISAECNDDAYNYITDQTGLDRDNDIVSTLHFPLSKVLLLLCHKLMRSHDSVTLRAWICSSFRFSDTSFCCNDTHFQFSDTSFYLRWHLSILLSVIFHLFTMTCLLVSMIITCIHTYIYITIINFISLLQSSYNKHRPNSKHCYI